MLLPVSLAGGVWGCRVLVPDRAALCASDRHHRHTELNRALLYGALHGAILGEGRPTAAVHGVNMPPLHHRHRAITNVPPATASSPENQQTQSRMMPLKHRIPKKTGTAESATVTCRTTRFIGENQIITNVIFTKESRY